MRTLWNEADYRELCTRLERLTPERPPRWGKLNAPQMVCHLTDALKMASGELPVEPKNLPIRYPPLKQLFVYLLPIPKGAPTAPELILRRPSEWQGEMQALTRELEAFRARGVSGPFVPHPAFGRLTPKAWGVLAYKHMHHHLRQFGC